MERRISHSQDTGTIGSSRTLDKKNGVDGMHYDEVGSNKIRIKIIYLIRPDKERKGERVNVQGIIY